MADTAETKKQAYDLAYDYERKYGGCPQCVLAALADSIGNIPDDVFKAATGLAAGIGGAGYACGAWSGGVMALGMYCGRERANFADPEGIRMKTFALARKLLDRFEAEYGSGDCRVIQTKLMGRSFDLMNPGERAQFLAEGGHEDKCPEVCAKAARWVVEILAEAGLIKANR